MELRERFEGQVQGAIRQMLSSVACTENVQMQLMCDDDLAALQPLIGDHIIFSVSGVIRLEDYLKMNPMQPVAASAGEEEQEQTGTGQMGTKDPLEALEATQEVAETNKPVGQ